MKEKVTPLFSWIYVTDKKYIPENPPPRTAYEVWKEPLDEPIPIQKDIVDKPKTIHYDSSKVIIKELTCKRCGRSWIPRSKKKPMQCPKCKSPYWNKARKEIGYMGTSGTDMEEHDY